MTTGKNGDVAFMHQLQERIEELKARRTLGETGVSSEIATLQGLKDVHAQLIEIKKMLSGLTTFVNRYPSLLYLVIVRPLSTLSYFSAGFIGLSTLYISDLRVVVFKELGLPSDLFVGPSGDGVLALVVALIVIGLIMDSRYNHKTEK